MKFKFIAYFAILTSLVFVGCDSKENSEQKTVEKKEDTIKIKEVKVKKTFTLTTTNGQLIEVEITDKGMLFKGYEGQAVLLNFFATWCAPCKAEIPHLNNLRNKYNGKFEIISVLLEENKNKEALDSFISSYKINYLVTNSEENFSLASALGGVRSIPTMFMFSKDGKLIQKFVGIVPEEMLESDIKKSLGL